MSADTTKLAVLAAALVFAALNLGLGIFLAKRHHRFVRERRRVQGVTLEPEAHLDLDDETIYTAVVEYRVDGRVYRISGSRASGIRSTERSGRTVWVHYLPDDPGNGRVVGVWERVAYASPLAVGLWVLVCIGFAIDTLA